MSLHPTPPRPGTLTARVLAQLWFGPVELGQAAAELGCTAPQVFHTLMRLRSALHYNVATLGSGRYGLRPGVFPGRPQPRPGSLTARVQERLRVCPTISLTRDAAHLSATPGQLLKSINALRLRWDLNIQRTAPGIFELRSGAYSERGYRGRQREPLTLAVLEQLRAAGTLDVHETALRTGTAPRRIMSALTSLRRDHAIACVGPRRYALTSAPSADAA